MNKESLHRMSNQIDEEIKVTAILVILILAILFVGLWSPYFEARSFNRCTGGDATYFDALFTELRVENCKTTVPGVGFNR